MLINDDTLSLPLFLFVREANTAILASYMSYS